MKINNPLYAVIDPATSRENQKYRSPAAAIVRVRIVEIVEE